MQRMEEEGRGGKRRQEGANEKEKRGAVDDGGGGSVLRGPFAVWMEAERGVVVATVACYFLG